MQNIRGKRKYYSSFSFSDILPGSSFISAFVISFILMICFLMADAWFRYKPTLNTSSVLSELLLLLQDLPNVVVSYLQPIVDLITGVSRN